MSFRSFRSFTSLSGPARTPPRTKSKAPAGRNDNSPGRRPTGTQPRGSQTKKLSSPLHVPVRLAHGEGIKRGEGVRFIIDNSPELSHPDTMRWPKTLSLLLLACLLSGCATENQYFTRYSLSPDA